MFKQEPGDHDSYTLVSACHRKTSRTIRTNLLKDSEISCMPSYNLQQPCTVSNQSSKSRISNTEFPILSQTSSTSASMSMESLDKLELDQNEIVYFGEIDLLTQDCNPIRSSRIVYANTVIARQRLRITHRRALLPAHTIPRTPFDSNVLPSGPSKSGFEIPCNISTLRPTVRFLTRLGTQLVRSQYDKIIGSDSDSNSTSLGPGSRLKRRRLDEDEFVCDELFGPIVFSIEHLEWKRKLEHPFWEGTILDICPNHHCPYLPTSSLQLLRHFELGHQKLFNVNTLCLPQKMLSDMTTSVDWDDGTDNNGCNTDSDDCQLSNTRGEILGDKLMGQFYAPLVINVHASNVYRCYMCPVCDFETSSRTLITNHVFKTSVCSPNQLGLSTSMSYTSLFTTPSPFVSSSSSETMTNQNLTTINPSLVSTASINQSRPIITLKRPFLSKSNHRDYPVLSKQFNISTAKEVGNNSVNKYPSTNYGNMVLHKNQLVNLSINNPTELFVNSTLNSLSLNSNSSKSIKLNGITKSKSSSMQITQSMTTTENENVSNRKRSSDFQGPSLVRVSLMDKFPCELCSVQISTSFLSQRYHIKSQHDIPNLPNYPSEKCFHCGQMFWQLSGYLRHQKVICSLCQKTNVCSSTFFVHMTLKHAQQLASMLNHTCHECPVCLTIFTNLASYIIHLQVSHYFTIPEEIFAISKSSPCPRFSNSTRLSQLSTLYSLLPTSRQSSFPLSYNLPNNILLFTSNSNPYPTFVCSICNCPFISVEHLDLHMIQSGHQYWCPSCSYACERAVSMWNHFKCKHSDMNQNQFNPSNPSFKVVKLLKPNALPKSSSNDVSMDVPSVVQSTAKSHQVVGSISQFHACQHCPVFCLTLEDLKTHCKTAHSHLSSNTNSTAIVTSNNIVPSPTPPPPSSISLPFGQKDNPVNFDQNFGINIVPSLSNICLSDHTDEDVMCPMCEFYSKNRSEVMQHIMDAH